MPTRQPEIRATDVIYRDLRGTPVCRQPSELWRRAMELPKKNVSDEKKESREREPAKEMRKLSGSFREGR